MINSDIPKLADGGEPQRLAGNLREQLNKIATDAIYASAKSGDGYSFQQLAEAVVAAVEPVIMARQESEVGSVSDLRGQLHDALCEAIAADLNAWPHDDSLAFDPKSNGVLTMVAALWPLIESAVAAARAATAEEIRKAVRAVRLPTASVQERMDILAAIESVARSVGSEELAPEHEHQWVNRGVQGMGLVYLGKKCSVCGLPEELKP